MRLFRLLLRKKQSKGHGIHSPFAFDLITNVLYSPYSYYAFSDIPEQFPYSPGLPKRVEYFNHISFRLVNYFRVINILEINPGNGINTHFITSPSSSINYHSIDLKKGAQEEIGLSGIKYDAIFINLHDADKGIPSINYLLEMSHNNTFWVINPIALNQSKQFCQDIVNHKSLTVTFDVKDTLVAFLRSSFHKQHYFV